MNWYYASNGQKIGPLPQEKLRELAHDGLITRDTLVWGEGMAAWQPWASVEFSLGGAIPSAGEDLCSECQRALPKDEMIAFEGNWICASCKPLFMQRLREGVALVSGGIWRSKKKLVTSLDAVFPQRCVKCNHPTNAPQMKRKLYWHQPAVYIALLVNIIIYAIVSLCVREKGTALISVCPQHRKKRSMAIAFSWLLIVGGSSLLSPGRLTRQAGPCC